MLQASWLQFCNIIPYDCRLTQVPHFPVGMGHHGLDLTSANGCFDSLCFYTWLFYQRLLCRIIRQVPLVYLFTCPNPSNGSTFWNVNLHWSGFSQTQQPGLCMLGWGAVQVAQGTFVIIVYIVEKIYHGVSIFLPTSVSTYTWITRSILSHLNHNISYPKFLTLEINGFTIAHNPLCFRHMPHVCRSFRCLRDVTRSPNLFPKLGGQKYHHYPWIFCEQEIGEQFF